MAEAAHPSSPKGHDVRAEAGHDFDLARLEFLDEPLMLLSNNHHIGVQAHGVNAQGMAFFRAGLYDLPLLDWAGQSVSKSGFDGHSQALPDDGQDAVQVSQLSIKGTSWIR